MNKLIKSSMFMLAMLLVLFLFGCSVPKEFFEFYELPEEERSRVFREFPIDKQIDYPLYAMLREPPDFTFSEEIAREGDVIVPAVLRRLRDEKADYRKVDILYIVWEFCHLNNCKENRPDIIVEVEREVLNIHGPARRRMAERSLSIMKGNPAPLPQVPRDFW